MDKPNECLYHQLSKRFLLKILFTAPFWSSEINSIAKGPIYLSGKGQDVLIITSQATDSLKGKVQAPAEERIDEAEFYRPYRDTKDFTRRPQICWQEIQKKVDRFRPSVVVGFGDLYYRLPLKLSHHWKVPLVMFFEYLKLDKITLPFRGGGRIREHAPGLYRFLAGLFRRHLAKQCDAIMFSYYGDRKLISQVERHCRIVRYVPWCTETEEIGDTMKRKHKTGIYIGSLESFKNAKELVKAIPIILNRTDTHTFTVVGPGLYAPEIRRLSEDYGDRLTYKKSVTRPEALRLIGSAGYGFTPVKDCGLGFIGDCWGSGTPLIATHHLDGFLLDGVDTLIANGIDDIPQTINKLLGSNELRRKLMQNGFNRYRSSHSAKAVGDAYLEVFTEALY
jgi:glycosyltransferase involved in cell wall biosynthesis